MASKLRLWTAADDKLALNPDLSASAVALKVGRTVTAVYARRQVLRGTSSRPRWRGAKSKPRLRPAEWILAKTCRYCGQFLMASEFAPHGGSLQSYCIACNSRRTSDNYATDDIFRARLTANTATSVGRRQTDTAARASNNRKEWTGPELELLTRSDLSHKDMALMLGRSLYAVRHKMQDLRANPREQRLANLGPGYQS